MSNDQATTTRSKATKATPASTAGETHSALVQMAKDNLVHARAGTIDQAESVKHIPSHHYTDEKRFELELQKVFRRMPLFMALSTELANPGDYKTMTVAGVPVLISRDKNGNANAYLNSCSHRGAQIMTEPKGNARQFSCPYHAWTYNHSGELIAIFNESDYGSIDKSCHSLVQLPSHESAGLIWVTLDPDSPLPISEFLSGYDSMLASFGFDTWQLFDSRTLKDPIGKPPTMATLTCIIFQFCTKTPLAQTCTIGRSIPPGDRTNAFPRQIQALRNTPTCQMNSGTVQT